MPQMTAQTPDILFFGGDEYFIFDSPLGYFPGLPEFIELSTANYRGYVAVWAVVGGRLFIVSLSGNGLERLFPFAQAPVQADWYSGEMRICRGREMTQTEADPIYEYETELTVERGRILSHRSVSRDYIPVHRFDPMLFQKVGYLEEIDPHTYEKLTAADIKTVGDLIQIGELDLIKTADVSVDAAIEVKKALALRGLVLGTSLRGWPPKNI